MNSDNRCPRCSEGPLQGWSELDEDEREVVRRLPNARDYDLEERQKRHSWCTRCWYESIGDSTQA